MGIVDRFDSNKEIELRDHLALERTKLANERTLFSYTRTSLYLLTGGIGLFEIEAVWHLRWLGWLCLAFSLVIFALGIYRFFLLRAHLKSYVRGSQE